MQPLKIKHLRIPPYPEPPTRIPSNQPETRLENKKPQNQKELIELAKALDLNGMGGAGFPLANKLAACTNVHTLLINGIECEPAVTIDQSILIHHSDYVKTGAETIARCIGAQEIMLCVKDKPALLDTLHAEYPYGIEPFPDRYPAGAEKWMIKTLLGHAPPVGQRPHEAGYLVQNVCTLRALGRALMDQQPISERPLSLIHLSGSYYQNLIAPIGMPIETLLNHAKCPFDPSTEELISGGLMMGTPVTPNDTVQQTTNALFIIPQKTPTERRCIQCGDCNTICPLKLHPVELVKRIEKGKTQSSAFKAQLAECFLCGACAAICPSNIPLTQQLAEGKKCLH